MKKVSLLLAIALCSQAIQATISIANLKGTHDILKDYSNWYAPFWGLPFAENDVARNLYVFSDFYNKKQFDEKSKEVTTSLFNFLLPDIEAYFKQDHKTATQTMVTWFFAEVAGTFNVTNSSNNPVKYLTFKDIGKIIRIMHDGTHNNNKAKAKSDPYDIIKTNLLAYFKEVLQKIPEATKNDLELFKQISNALIGSLKECSATNPDRLFPENMTQGILLGYILMKGNNRSDLQNYFEGFLGKDIELPQEAATKQKVLALTNTPGYTKEELATLVDTSITPVNLQDINSVANYICTQEYKNLYLSTLPKLVIYSSQTTFNSFSFSDCMETTLLNLANIATYDPEQHTFETTIPALQKFYQTYNTNTETDINHIDTHNAWTNLVENIPYVYYKQIGDLQSKQRLSVYYDGFIPVTTVDTTLPKQTITIGAKQFELYEKKWNDQTFLLVPATTNLVCFEVRSSLRNVIIVMNKLFNLNLYQSNNATFEPDFETTYFAPLCEKLGWTAQKIDTSNFKITTRHNNTFALNIRLNSHGYIEIPENISVTNAPFQDTTIEQLKAINIALRDANVSDIKNLYFGNLKDTNNRLAILQKLAKIEQDTKSPIIDNNIISFGFINDLFMQSSLIDTYSHRPSSLNIMTCINLFLYQQTNSKNIKVLTKSQFQSYFESCMTNLSDSAGNNEVNFRMTINIINFLLVNELLNQQQIQSLVEFIKAKYSKLNLTAAMLVTPLIKHLLEKKLLDQSQIQSLFEFAMTNLSDRATNAHMISVLLANKLLDQQQIQSLVEFIKANFSKPIPSLNDHLVMTQLLQSKLLDQSQIQSLFELAMANLFNPNFTATGNATDLIKGLLSNKLLDQSQIRSLFEFINNAHNNDDYRYNTKQILGLIEKENL